MNRADPFSGYTIVLRTIIYGLVPAFSVWQYFRYRRALHVFQLEGYKRGRFLEWCRTNRERAWFLGAAEAKKPLVMTGRARRILWATTLITPFLILIPAGVMHVGFGGWPYDVITWAVMTGVVFVLTPRVLLLGDLLMTPVQRAINARFLRAARARLAEIAPVVVGVTGSFGKTSTKNAIARLLGPPDGVLATPGSFNTPLGVCRTINEQLSPGHRYLVVEMGAYGEGEIAELMDFVKPSIGVLTAIGPAHLERFGSMDAIRSGKYEVVRDLSEDGTAVMNVDDPEVRTLADGTSHVRVVRFGIEPAGRPDVTARDIAYSPSGTSFTVTAGGESAPFSTHLLGRHSVGHVLAGVVVGLASGRSLTEMASAAAELEPVEHRLQLIHGVGGVTVIDDAYNSNPEGAAAALEVLAAMEGARKVVVTPGIIELGELQESANREFGRQAGAVADHLLVVARVNRDVIVAGAKGGRAQVETFDTLTAATERLRSLLQPGDVVLFENDLPDQLEG
ncbi:MAG: hypothetical protein GEU71_08625 [Actinobacteria bacterium]|nr:hypothetical protein [Actinomycetota bacterium]